MIFKSFMTAFYKLIFNKFYNDQWGKTSIIRNRPKYYAKRGLWLN